MSNRYDVYLTKEPDVYEAMVLVHSRVRRVAFGVRDRSMGRLGGASDGSLVDGRNGCVGVHSLPGTNHHYRAFMLDIGGGDCGADAVALLDSMRKIHGGRADFNG